MNLAWARWWDPIPEVLPNDPLNIVTGISDAQIIAIADAILSDLSLGKTSVIAFADLLALNSLTPGMGDAATNLLTVMVRAFAHSAQGAAAFAQDGFGAPSVLAAAAAAVRKLAG